MQPGCFQRWSNRLLITCDPPSLHPQHQQQQQVFGGPSKGPAAGVCAVSSAKLHTPTLHPPSPLLTPASNCESDRANSEPPVSDKNRTWCPCVPEAVNAQLLCACYGLCGRAVSLYCLVMGSPKNEAIHHPNETGSHYREVSSLEVWCKKHGRQMPPEFMLHSPR